MTDKPTATEIRDTLDEARRMHPEYAMGSPRAIDNLAAHVCMLCDVVEEVNQRASRYGLALMMIAEGAEDPKGFAAKMLNYRPKDTA